MSEGVRTGFPHSDSDAERESCTKEMEKSWVEKACPPGAPARAAGGRLCTGSPLRALDSLALLCRKKVKAARAYCCSPFSRTRAGATGSREVLYSINQ